MSKAKGKRDTRSSGQPRRRATVLLWLLLALSVVVVVVAVRMAVDGGAARESRADTFQPLLGRWVRPDGGYVIEIRSVDPAGKLDARYYNPNPIHVSRAWATLEGERLGIFVELNDVNYPGATYDLVYDPPRDRLLGRYDQPKVGQVFDVTFARMPPGR
jgi:hypothetical protein